METYGDGRLKFGLQNKINIIIQQLNNPSIKYTSVLHISVYVLKMCLKCKQLEKKNN